MLHYKGTRVMVIIITFVIVMAVGIEWAVNPKDREAEDMEQTTELLKDTTEFVDGEGPTNIDANAEIMLEQPDKSVAVIISDLANQEFSINEDRIKEADHEAIVDFGKAFVNLYTGAVSEQESVSFENYISNNHLNEFIVKMLELEQKRELKGGIGVHFSLDNEFQETELKQLDENLYYLNLSFVNQGSGMNCELLVQAENKILRVVDLYFGNKDGVDTVATGHPADRKLDDPALWDDPHWIDAVHRKLEQYETDLES